MELKILYTAGRIPTFLGLTFYIFPIFPSSEDFFSNQAGPRGFRGSKACQDLG